jgi:hypothetical protein
MKVAERFAEALKELTPYQSLQLVKASATFSGSVVALIHAWQGLETCLKESFEMADDSVPAEGPGDRPEWRRLYLKAAADASARLEAHVKEGKDEKLHPVQSLLVSSSLKSFMSMSAVLVGSDGGDLERDVASTKEVIDGFPKLSDFVLDVFSGRQWRLFYLAVANHVAKVMAEALAKGD